MLKVTYFSVRGASLNKRFEPATAKLLQPQFSDNLVGKANFYPESAVCEWCKVQ